MIAAIVSAALITCMPSWDLIMETHQGQIWISRQGTWRLLNDCEGPMATSLITTPLGPAVCLDQGVRIYNRIGHEDYSKPWKTAIRKGRFTVNSGKKHLLSVPEKWVPKEVRFCFKGQPKHQDHEDPQVVNIQGPYVLFSTRNPAGTTVKFWNRGVLKFSNQYPKDLSVEALLCRNAFSISWTRWNYGIDPKRPVKCSMAFLSSEGRVLKTVRRQSEFYPETDEWMSGVDFSGDRCLLVRRQMNMGWPLFESSFKHPSKWAKITGLQADVFGLLP